MNIINFNQSRTLVALYERIPAKTRSRVLHAPRAVSVNLEGIQVRVGYTVHNTPFVFAVSNGLEFFLGYDTLDVPNLRDMSMNRPWVYAVDCIPESSHARHRDLPVITYKGWSVREGQVLTRARIVIVELAETDLKLLLCIDRAKLFLDSGFGGGRVVQHREVLPPATRVMPVLAPPLPAVMSGDPDLDVLLASLD